MKKAVATKKKFYNKSRGSRTRNRSRSRSASPKRYDKNRSGSSRSYNNNRKRKSGGRDSGDSKAKRAKSDSSSKKKGIISSCISSWPSFFTSKAILLVTALGLVIDHIPSLDNIPLGGRLSQFINNWHIVCDNNWVLSVVEHGYKIPLKKVPKQKKYPSNPPSSGSAYDVLVNEALQLKFKNAVHGVTSVMGQYVSSYFAVPKPRKIDQFRPILNLKYFNNYVKKYKFHMETLSNVRDWIKPHAYCIGLDLRDAFLHIPIHKDSKKYLRFKWLNELLEWQVLPFGLTCSPRVITKVLKPIIGFLRSTWGILISIYIDDILIQNLDPHLCSLHAQLVVLVLNSLGWGFKPEKCDIIPRQKFIHLGFEFDTSKMTITCPSQKVSRLQQMCSDLLAKDHCKLLLLEKLIGTIESVRPSVPLAALNYRSLQYQLLKAKAKIRNPNTVIILSQKSRNELCWWVSPTGFAVQCSAPIRELSPTVDIWSDANLLRGGSHCSRGTYHQRNWSLEEQEYHINFLELRAAKESLTLARDGDLVRLHIDNKTAVAYIKKQGGTRSSRLCHEACQLWRSASLRNITLLTPHWISTKENSKADFLSRHDVLQWEFRLSGETFRSVIDHFKLDPTMDVYASKRTHQLDRYMSWHQDPQAVAQDALIHPWDQVSYVFPPVPLITKTLQKIMKEELEVVMIVPHWPTAIWWSLIQEMLTAPLLVLPNYKTVLIMESNQELPYLHPLVAVHLKA